jgi:hypothetical protein
LFALLDGYFSANIAQNARQYIQYCLCFGLPWRKTISPIIANRFHQRLQKIFEKYFLQKFLDAKKRLFLVNSRFSPINIGIIEGRRKSIRRPNKYYYSTLLRESVSKSFGFFLVHFAYRQSPLASAILKPEGNPNTQITVKKTGRKGLIPMAFGDTPPNQQNRIDAERNESKGLV